MPFGHRRGSRTQMADAASSAAVQCSFCGKNQDEVRKLIAGPYVYICDECIDLCNEILEQECEAEGGAGDPPMQSESLTAASACVLCRLPKSIEELVPLPELGFICRTCVDTIRIAADQQGKLDIGDG